jgi:hypothetical protein
MRMKEPTQDLIAEVRRCSLKVGMTIGMACSIIASFSFSGSLNFSVYFPASSRSWFSF